MESDDTFEYDEELLDFSFHEDADSITSLKHDDGASVTSADDEYRQNDGDLKKSANFLSHSLYKPFLLLWYIKEHYLIPCQAAQKTILPAFTFQELLVMFHYKKWLVNETADDYYNHWPKLRDACGLTDERGVIHNVIDKDDFMCMICCETGSMPVFGLQCGHQFCTLCYAQYIQGLLGKGQLIRCMDILCQLSLYHEDVEKVLTPASAMEQNGSTADVEPESTTDEKKANDKDQTDDPLASDLNNESDSDSDSDKEYDRHFEGIDLLLRLMHLDEDDDPMLANLLLRSAAKNDIDALKKRFKWCPAVDCTNFVELTVDDRPEWYSLKDSKQLSYLPIVRCPAAHEFCFDCQYENHLPCPCWLVAKWLKRCEDDLETAHWIDANTQPCPKCFLNIEKNGGCNHMTCQTCGYEFCWICLDIWKIHGTANYECNRFDAEKVSATKKKRSEKQDSLNRYLHFYRRFAIHQTSMAGDERTLNNVHKCMLLYMKSQRGNNRNSSWNDVQFMSDAIRSLSSGRKTLMWTYAFSFYMAKSNFAEIFAGMQDYLTKTVEDLSRLFEDVNAVGMTSKTKETVMSNLTKKKAAIVSLSAIVTKRQKLLIEYAASSLELNTLVFNDL